MERKSTEDGSAEERTRDLRRRILEIQQDPKLTIQEKAKLMQRLLAGKWAEEEKTPEKAETHSAAELEPTYTDNTKTILGCKHYRRNCKIKAACCGRIFTCRFCHDDASDHPINRYDSLTVAADMTAARHATEEVLCMKCRTIQPVSNTCQKCGQVFARYYCPVCKFFDDDPKKDIYHCHQCGICRRGKGLGIDYFHCDTCGACLALEMQNNHRCIENNFKSNCPICHQQLFSSTEPAVFLPCQHLMHRHCYRAYVRTNFICPVSFAPKSVGDMTETFLMMDAMIQQNQMPPEFAATKANILCNDCEKRCTVPYHFIAHKCTECGSYNTRLLGTINFPTYYRPPTAPSTPNDIPPVPTLSPASPFSSSSPPPSGGSSSSGPSTSDSQDKMSEN